MRKLLSALVLLAFCSPIIGAGMGSGWGSGIAPGAVVVVKQRGAGGSPGTGGSILHETFDASGFDATGWTKPASWGHGVVNEDASTNPPVGSVTGFTGQAMRTYTPDYGDAHAQWDAAAPFSTSYLSVYFYIASESLAPGVNGDYFNLMTLTSAAGADSDNTWWRVRYKETQTPTVQLVVSHAGNSDGTGCTTGSGSITVTTGTSYLIEATTIENGSSDSFELRVNGVVVCSHTGSLWAASPQRLILGPSGSNTWAWDSYWDTLDIDATAYIH